MPSWNPDQLQHAWNFVSQAHNQQTLPGSDVPYLSHLGLVAMEAMATVVEEPVDQPDLLVLCALLHDTLEDTATTYAQIANRFGQEIAEGVKALTKDTTLPTKEAQMADSLCRIKGQPREVWMVKLCDRITNLQRPPKHWNRDKITAYHAEAQLILAELSEASPRLASRLAEKIKHYAQYC